MNVRKPRSDVAVQPGDEPVIGDESDETDEQPAVTEPPSVRKHTPIWTDMVRVMLVFAGAYIMMQFIMSAIMTVLIFFFDSPIQDYLTDRTNAGESLQAVFDDPATTQFLLQRVAVYGLLITIVGDVAALSLYLIIRKKKLFTTDITTTKPVNNRWLELGAAIVFIFGIQLVLSLVDSLISLSGYDPSTVQSNLIGPDTNTVIGFFSIVIIAPFLEEWMFRGAILRHLVPYGVNFAIVTQALLFGLWHSNLYQGIFAFVTGLILGYVAFNFSLKWSYAMHATSNGVAFLFGISWMPQWLPGAFFALAFIASAVIIVHFRKVIPLVVAEGAPQIDHPFQQGWKNPAFIAVAAVLFVICCVMMVVAGG